MVDLQIITNTKLAYISKHSSKLKSFCQYFKTRADMKTLFTSNKTKVTVKAGD